LHYNLDRTTGNYANISSVKDIIFGIYICPDREFKSFGIKAEFRKNYLGQLIKPIIPDTLWRRFKLYPQEES
jgi:sterol desaturase/sphingolipid hydroxylase (fatty acid hydroxylase superfamily)